MEYLFEMIVTMMLMAELLYMYRIIFLVCAGRNLKFLM